MALKFDISQLNPLKLYHQSDVFNLNSVFPASLNTFHSNHNHRHIDDDFMYRNLQDWQDKVKYFQPYQQADVITLQWVAETGNNINYYVYVIDCHGKVIKSMPTTLAGPLGTSTTEEVIQAFIPLYDVPEGKYFCFPSYKYGFTTCIII
jgi:hypothetical protein